MEDFAVTITMGVSEAMVVHDILINRFRFDMLNNRLSLDDQFCHSKTIIEIEEFICGKLGARTMADIAIPGKSWREPRFEAYVAISRFIAKVDEYTGRYKPKWNDIAENRLRLITDNS